jgi:hypothetical protein
MRFIVHPPMYMRAVDACEQRGVEEKVWLYIVFESGFEMGFF